MHDEYEAIWAEYAGPLRTAKRPSFRFDPEFYLDTYPDLKPLPYPLAEHFEKWGRREGRQPTRFRTLLGRYPDLPQRLAPLMSEPRLAAALEAGNADAGELAFELIKLGEGVDSRVSDFSAEHYLRTYPDIARAGIDPLLHYLLHGRAEGRVTLNAVRRNHHAGERRHDPSLPTCLIVTHEMSRSGAPIVALDLAREARGSWNVVVLSLRGGSLLDRFREQACDVVVTSNPQQDFDWFQSKAIARISRVIVNSVAASSVTDFLVGKGWPFAAYVHEYPQYLYPVAPYMALPLHADLVAFSSEQMRGTWLPRLTDIEFDVQRDSLVLPQREARVGEVDAARLAAARERLSRLIGRDCSGARIVCGAGQVTIRKGVDIFAMTSQIARARDPETLFVWIGEGLSREDLGFGAYLSAHLDMIGAGGDGSNLFFLPAGDHYPDVLTAADALFLSSRLDPLPNVGFDALQAGCRLLVFEGASGFSDPAYHDLGHIVSVEYGNPAAASEALLALPRKQPGSLPVPAPAPAPRTRLLDPIMDAIESRLKKRFVLPFRQSGRSAAPAPRTCIFDPIMDALEARLEQRRRIVLGGGPPDPRLFVPEGGQDLWRRKRERLFASGRRLYWRDAADAAEALELSGNWVHSACEIRDPAPAPASELPGFAVHLHAGSAGAVASDLHQHPLIARADRLVVTTESEREAERIAGHLKSLRLAAEIRVVEGGGRGLPAFLDLFETGGPGDDHPIWCHLHQDDSLDAVDAPAKDGPLWHRHLKSVLLGGEGAPSGAPLMLAEGSAGIVTAFSPHVMGWNEARALLPRIEKALPGPLPRNPLLFPMTGMLWTRSEVARAMAALARSGSLRLGMATGADTPERQLVERLWPAVCASLGRRAIFIETSNLTRDE